MESGSTTTPAHIYSGPTYLYDSLMSSELSLGEVVALLFEEHRYEDPLSPKAVHKLLYFIEDELSGEQIAVNIPIFWYMYGAMAVTAETGVRTGGEPNDGEVVCDIDVAEIAASESTIRKGRRGVTRALDRYYDLGLEGLTDKMYDGAPYEVQRNYRTLDKQLEAAADNEQMTLTGDKNVARTRETLYDLVGCFPTDDFPSYEDDLHIWYRLMSAELDSEEYDPEEAQKYAEAFWRLFCLELAVRENDGLTHEEIEDELNLGSLSSVKDGLRSTLRRWEREKSESNARNSEKARKAADVLVLPYLDFEVTG